MAPAPRWINALHKTLSEHEKASVFTVASSDAHSVPHARSQIYRHTLTPKSHPNLPVLITSTDVRTPKVSEILDNPTNSGPFVELCWWIDPTKEQFRIKGKTFIVPAPAHPLHARFDVNAAPGVKALVHEDGVDFEKERKTLFDGMSAHMKAAWLRPPPGSILKGGYEESKKWVETVPRWEDAQSDEERKNYEVALGNFAVMAIEPVEVDYLEMAIVPNRRRRYVRDGEGGWEEHVVVP